MLFGWRKDEASRPWRLSAKLLIISSVATVIGFSAICANVMLDMRRGEEALARQMLENLASGIDADISRNIELYDLSLRAVASNMVAAGDQGRSANRSCICSCSTAPRPPSISARSRCSTPRDG